MTDASDEVKQLAKVPEKWSTAGWAARLRDLADRCEPYHPKRAATLRQAANLVRAPQPIETDYSWLAEAEEAASRPVRY